MEIVVCPLVRLIRSAWHLYLSYRNDVLIHDRFKLTLKFSSFKFSHLQSAVDVSGPAAKDWWRTKQPRTVSGQQKLEIHRRMSVCGYFAVLRWIGLKGYIRPFRVMSEIL